MPGLGCCLLQVTLDKEYETAANNEKQLLERAMSAERQLSALQGALQRERELVEKVKKEAVEAAASAQNKVRLQQTCV